MGGKIVTLEFDTDEAAETFNNVVQLAVGKSGLKAAEVDYHTPHELYEHRYHLYRALVFSSPYRLRSWRARLHADGTSFKDSFIVGINLMDRARPGTRNDITYHLPNSWWDSFNGLTTYDMAPEYDGASPQEGLRRLEAFVERTKTPHRHL
jgi:hypothetical protein